MGNPASSAAGLARIPWPGPRPYDEEDWDRFYGRDRDFGALLNRVQAQKLTVLLGASGIGKTSLIRAGIVPMLRQERYHPQGDHLAWPVLLLRRWGAVDSTSLEVNLLLQLESAIDAIQVWGERLGQEGAVADAKHLRDVLEATRQKTSERPTILEVVEELARVEGRRSAGGEGSVRETGGLILILDQFEEQLRGGTQAVSEALGFISNLYHSGAPTRVLLSMRREYFYALRRLELTTGGLSSRSFFLEPLEAPAVVRVLKESSRNSDIPIDKDVAERIVRWLTPDSRNDLEEAVATGAQAGGDTGSDPQSERERPDLLRLQAVLVELSHFVLGRTQASVNMALFEEFMSQFANGEQESRGYDGPLGEVLLHRVLDGALERWIEAALRSETGGFSNHADSRRFPSDWARMTPEDLRQQVRRIGIRLAPLLSSGDYKISQEENTLFHRALGEEIARLGIKAPELHWRIRVIERDEMHPPRLNWDELGLAEDSSSGARHKLSGLARVENWSLSETGDQIVVCFKETLHRLARANILQCTSQGIERKLYWELVHDQFGPHLMKWAEGQRGTWDDCRSSLVVCSGLQPIAVPVTEIKPDAGMKYYDLTKISWQGCRIENSRSERLTLRNVRFQDCFLVGTIFEAIDFVGCSFEGCDLKGGLFRNCGFRVSDIGEPTVFTRCDSNITIVGGVIESLEFRNCHLLQPAIIDTFLEGEVRYTQGSRVLQAFYDVRCADVSGSIRVSFDEGSRGFQCTGTRSSFGYLGFEAEDSGMHNVPLRDDFRLRPRRGWQEE
jgi:conflict system STAND superfamily ATPase/pentapeptide repeat protein